MAQQRSEHCSASVLHAPSVINVLSLGISIPLAGVLAGVAGVASVYLAGAVTVALSVVAALVLLCETHGGGRQA
ncbi:hypothetical protein AFK24_05470 [Pseudomonas syringae]|uniref:Uncharacterized protein n=1 Tax=Pseudomonas syringae TaxID=317 RepID=A0A1C7Z7U5_PSESX|nr:hypothetical protein [Pseudomonas syringae]OCR26011.1 hypothetical protein AFK24_05470 [Pseudomonas syringae]